MVSTSASSLLLIGVITNGSTVRRRTGEPKVPSVQERKDHKMVPKINVVHIEEPLNGDGSSQTDENDWRGSDEELSRTQLHHISHVNGSVKGVEFPELCNSPLEPLLPAEKGDDELKTEISGPNEDQESSLGIALQVFFPFLVAGFGTVSAGLLLDLVQVSVHHFIRSAHSAYITILCKWKSMRVYFPKIALADARFQWTSIEQCTYTVQPITQCCEFQLN